MTPAAPSAPRTANRTRPRVATVTVVTAPAPPVPPAARRRRARRALAAFVLGAVLLHLAALLALDATWPRLRDPEYGRRATRLGARVEENPDRPLVLVVGSSRTAMGVRPGAWEEARPGMPHDPMLFNLSVVGGGPITELLLVRRAQADGFRPAVVLLEFWPPLLRQDGPFAETLSLATGRLRLDDRPVVRGYFPRPAETEREMREARLNPISANRSRLLLQALPLWVGKYGRIDPTWTWLDKWGWLPGMDPAPEDTEGRRILAGQTAAACRARLDGCAVHQDSDRALRETVATARAGGAKVGLVYLPEGSEFRATYPPEVDAAFRAYLTAVSGELGVPVIDGRCWADDRDLADGFHLTRPGAARFTARLGAAVAATFPTGGPP